MRSNHYRLAATFGVALSLWFTATPALGDDREYDPAYGGWDQQQGPPPEAAQYGDDAPQYAPPSNVDVSVEMGTPGAQVSFATFQDGLAPYGEWVSVGAYGRVWRPTRVAAGWRPYYYGRWEWTDEGWLWVSDEPWGWAAYHYGRWAYDSYYGWVWIPGYQWAPAWVTWRYSPDYIGWAPLGPGFSVYVTSYPAVYGWWTFVPCRRFVGVPVHSIAFTGRRVHDIYGATRPAPPRVAMYGAHAPAWGGPARPFIEQHVGHPVAPVRVQAVASPKLIGTVRQPGFVQVYRPEAHLPARAAPSAAPPRTGQAFARPAAPGAGTGASVMPGGPAQGVTAAPAPQRPLPSGGGAFTGTARAAPSRPSTAPGIGAAPQGARPVPAPGATSRVPSGLPSRPSQGGGGFAAPAPAAPRPAPGPVPTAPAPHFQAPAPRAQPQAPAAAPAPGRTRPQSYTPPSAAPAQRFAAAPAQRAFSPPAPSARPSPTMSPPHAAGPSGAPPAAHGAPANGHRR